MLGQLVSKKILPTVFGVAIPNLSLIHIWMCIRDRQNSL